MYLIAKRFNPLTKKYSIAKRRIATISFLEKIENRDGNLVLRTDLAVWPISDYGISDSEANRRVSNYKHDFDADGYDYVPAHVYESKNP